MIIHEEGTASIREKIRIVYNNRRSNRYLKLIADGKKQPDLEMVEQIIAVSDYYVVPVRKDQWDEYQRPD